MCLAVAGSTRVLKPIGQAIPVDANGTLPRIGKPPVEPWASLTATLAKTIQRDLTDNFEAVILRGSLPRGTAVSGVSDIDLVIVMKTPDADYEVSTLPTDIKLDISISTSHELQHDDAWVWMRFSLAFSGWTMLGRDLIPQFPAPTLGPHAFAHLHSLEKWANAWEGMFIEAIDDIERKEISQWLMKRIIRSLFESVMLDTQTYTRDIYPCALAAIQYYPAAKAEIWRAAELAISPSASLAKNMSVANPMLALLRQICSVN